MNKKQSKNIKIASFSATEQVRTFNRADIYASKMIADKFMVKIEGRVAPSRGIASEGFQRETLEGMIGYDSWGYPLQFMVKKNPINPSKGTLVIWSAGADSKLETDRDMIAENHKNFNGDDFGKTYKF